MAEKTYKNVGGAPVLGNAPGKVFQADIPDDQLKRMIDRGSIEEVDPKDVTEVAPEEAAEQTEVPSEVSHDDNAGSGDGDKKDGEQKGPKVPDLKQQPLGKKG